MLHRLIVSCFCDLGTVGSLGSEAITRSQPQALRFRLTYATTNKGRSTTSPLQAHMFDDVLISKELLKLLNRQTSIPRDTAHRECINRIMSGNREDANAI